MAQPYTELLLFVEADHVGPDFDGLILLVDLFEP
jgi:hypothetical protein